MDARPESPPQPCRTMVEADRPPSSDPRRNLALLAVHQILFRVGWLFKTESVVIPGFLDYLAGPGAGWLRGFLPVLSRVGQGAFPLLFAHRLERSRHASLLLGVATMLLVGPMLFFSALALLGKSTPGGAALAFLGAYFVFSCLYGVYQLAFGVVQGRLVPPDRRGRLLSLSTFWGTVPAVLMAIWLLPGRLDIADPRYDEVFFAGGFFLGLSSLVCFALPRGAARGLQATESPPRHGVWRLLRNRGPLRWLLASTLAYSVALILIPHYQAFARDHLQLGNAQRGGWIITQSVSVGLFSVLVGWLADRRGNRATLCGLILVSALSPIWAGALPLMPEGWAAKVFWITFVTLGLTTLVPRVAGNFALELVSPEEYSQATAIVQMGYTLPLAASPLVGWVIDRVGFEPVCWSASAVIVLSAGLLLFVPEPRVERRLPSRVVGYDE
ncbi:MAG: hypothetical protein Kow0040_26300 [Thermogutta sp.]